MIVNYLDRCYGFWFQFAYLRRLKSGNMGRDLTFCLSKMIVNQLHLQKTKNFRDINTTIYICIEIVEERITGRCAKGSDGRVKKIAKKG